MLHRLLPIFAIALALAGRCQAARPENARITAVRFWTLSEVTRVAVESTGEFVYRSERLHNPERIFFDVSHARPAIEGKRAYSVEVNDKLVKRIRVALTQPGVTRVVLDLEGPADYTDSVLSNPDRLMIELRPAAGPAIPPAITSPAGPSVPGINPAMTPNPPPPPVKADAEPISAAAGNAARSESARSASPPSRAARPTTGGGNSLIRALGLKVTRVVIDPGHGGHDHGTVGPRGLMEKDLVLDIARRLGKLIEERMGSEIIYTRTDDTFVPLEGRTELANLKRADLFLSIHANSSPYPRTAGVETYYLNLTTAKDALDVASRENASSPKSIFELRDLIQKITLQDKVEESREFAGRVQTALQVFERRYNPSARNRGVKKAPFVVLIGASMPSILAEVGFLSNAREEALLKRAEHRQKLAEALYAGVSRYANGLSHFQIARAKD